MGLATLILGLVLFIGPHVLVAFRGSRAALIARIGEWPYKGLFALVSIVGVVLIGYGFGEYRATGWIDVWSPPVWTRHIVVVLMWPASICVVAPYFPGAIKTTLKHPMLVGVKLWAFAHLCANGDLGSIILFGSILAWAVFDRISLKRRSDPGGIQIPAGGRRNDIIALIVGTILYLLLGFFFHPMVVGVHAFGTPAHGS
jgi:uncharacterized membrane protein